MIILSDEQLSLLRVIQNEKVTNTDLLDVVLHSSCNLHTYPTVVECLDMLLLQHYVESDDLGVYHITYKGRCILDEQ